EPVFVQNGTFLKMHWPEIASCLCVPEPSDLYKTTDFHDDFSEPQRPFDVYRLLQAYAAFNPHATFRVTGLDGTTVELPATNAQFQKWLPGDPTCPHWYDSNRFRSLIGANLANERSGGRPRTVRDFVSEFNGLKRSAKQKAVTEAAGLAGDYLRELLRDGDV